MSRRGDTFYAWANCGTMMNGQRVWALFRPFTPTTMLGGGAFPATIDLGVAGCSHNNINAGATIVTTAIDNYSLTPVTGAILAKRPIHYQKFIASDFYTSWDWNNWKAIMDRGSAELNTQPDSVANPVDIMDDYNSNPGTQRDNTDITERFWGVFTAPVEGDYKFALSSDDESQLLMSPDAQIAGRVEIVRRDGWCHYREYPAPRFPRFSTCWQVRSTTWRPACTRAAAADTSRSPSIAPRRA